MTTNHKPTFESRTGRDLQPSSISHSRKVAGHTKLKYRDGYLGEKESKEKFNELRKELRDRDRESRNNKEVKLLEGGVDTAEKQEDQGHENKQQETEHAEGEVKPETKTQIETKISTAEEQQQPLADSDSGSDSDSDSDSEDEAELLAELAKIKAERAAASSTTATTTNEPSSIATTTEPVKKSWRDTSIFKAHRNNSTHHQNNKRQREQDEYINDMIKGQGHKRFMDKFIR